MEVTAAEGPCQRGAGRDRTSRARARRARASRSSASRSSSSSSTSRSWRSRCRPSGATSGSTPAGLQWVISAYTLTFGGGLLLAGRVADLYGARRAFRRRAAAVRRRLARLRARADGRRADRGARGPGSGRGAGGAVGARAARRHRARGAPPARARWRLDRGGGRRRRVRLGARRPDQQRPRLGVGVRGQRADRARRAPRSPAGCCRATTSPARAGWTCPARSRCTLGLGAVLFGLSRTEHAGLSAATIGSLAAGAVLLAAFSAASQTRSSRAERSARPGLARGSLVALALTGTTSPAMFLAVLQAHSADGPALRARSTSP